MHADLLVSAGFSLSPDQWRPIQTTGDWLVTICSKSHPLSKPPVMLVWSQLDHFVPCSRVALGMPNNAIAQRTLSQAHMYMAQMLAINMTHVVRTVQKNLFESVNYFFCMSHKPYLISK